jgi:hypothetical protein
MSTWQEQKKSFLERKDKLDDLFSPQNNDKRINRANANMGQYISKAGISTGDFNTDPGQIAKNMLATMQSGIEQYINLNKDISAVINSMTNSGDVSSKLQMEGQLQQDIPRLEQNLKAVRQDLDTARTRQGQTEEPPKHTSLYQGFSGKLGFTKPLKRTSIPFLIGFGILLLFLSSLLLKEFFISPSGFAEALPQYSSQGVMSVFTDTRFLSFLGGVVFVFVATAVLVLMNYFGKTAI